MKKICTLAMVVCFLFVLGSVSNADMAIEIQPFYVATSSITATLSIDSSGNAECSGKIKPMNSTYSTSITVKLMKKSGSTWSEVKRWTASKAGITGASASGSVKVSKGYTYQVRVSGNVVNSGGTTLESPTKNSAEKAY